MTTGRPTDYSDDLIDDICQRIALGGNLNLICAEDGMPAQETVYRWRREYPIFNEKYDLARQARADARSDRIDELNRKVELKSVEPAAAAVMLKAEIWQAGRENPKRYGEKITHSGDAENPINHKIGVSDDLAEVLSLDQLMMVEKRVLAKRNAGGHTDSDKNKAL